ncbi:MAG TPA: glycosyltransferase [Candidatus Eremiobacteraceae bacterium]|jgi:glycosyltransferase involved in cell wall biosynthesis|nr:glycosyltransferase [Candidatus Eremiobacteraceae bacterium]
MGTERPSEMASDTVSEELAAGMVRRWNTRRILSPRAEIRSVILRIMTAGSPPQLSLVIAAYNDWAALERCIASVASQRSVPEFEVIVIDDGSETEVPASVTDKSSRLQLRVIRQGHSGIAVARNRGVQEARGDVVLFTDCDCVLDPDCLHELARAAVRFPDDAGFQLRLTADTRSTVGRAEALQHFAVQQGRLDAAGRLMYLNTSGFAIRRDAALAFGQLFDPLARRGEDTLLLSQLMKRGQVPHYLPDAAIQHAVRLPLGRYMWVGLSVGYKEGYAYAKIANNAEKLDPGTSQRWEQLKRLHRIAKERSLGTGALLVVFVRQVLRLFGLKFYRLFS